MNEFDRIINEYQEKIRRGKEVGSGTSSALATIPKTSGYEEKTSDNPVEEEIDAKILQLLGLEDTSDFTYDEYKTLLKEKMVSGRMVDSEMDSGDTELLTDEYKRVRSNTGQFVVRSKSPLVESIGRKRSGSSPTNTESVNNLIESSSDVNEDQDEKINYALVTLPDTLNTITSVLSDINNVLAAQVSVDESELEDKQQQDVENQRKKEEDKGEKKKKGFLSRMKNIKLPKFDFFDAIKTFFTNVAIGGALSWLFNWINDPENEGKIDEISDMVEKWLPWVLGGLLALALVPVASTIFTMLIAVKAAFGALVAVISGLAPILLPVLATVGTIIAVAKGIDYVRNKTQGEGVQSVHNELNKKLEDAGMTPDGMNTTSDMGDIGGPGAGRTPEQDKIFQEVQVERKRLHSLSEKMRRDEADVDEETKKAIEEISKDPEYSNPTISYSREQTSAGGGGLNEKGKEKVKSIEEAANKRKDKIRETVDKEAKNRGSVMNDGISLSDELLGTGEADQDRLKQSMKNAKDMTPGSGEKTRVPGVGTIQAGRNFFGQSETKYFDVSGNKIDKEEFYDLYESQEGKAEKSLKPSESPTPEAEVRPTPEAEVEAEDSTPMEVEPKPTGTEIVPEMSGSDRKDEEKGGGFYAQLDSQIKEDSVKIPKPPGSPSITVIPIPVTKESLPSSSGGNQKDPPSIPSSDPNNDNLLITKSIYNIIQ
jgi:hypothetical protein